MNILLLNDNPVVNKLVTLSAQKTSDNLEVVATADEISESSYDLLVVDDTVYSPELFTELQAKITFSKSLYICSRDAEEDDNFTKTIKKPFLPTDLVELFSTLGKEISETVVPGALEESTEEIALEEFTSTEEVDLEEDMGDIEDLSFEDDEDLDLDISDLGELEELDDLEDADDISLDDELSFEDDEELEGVLDKDELKEVQDLLDETEEDLEVDELDDLSVEDESDLDDELDLEDLNLEDVNIESSIESEEDSEVDELEEFSLESESDLDDVNIESSIESEEDSEVDELEEFSLETDLGLDLESEIENAVSELSQEELDSEIDEDTLLDIVSSEIDNIDLLNARDLQMAIGEEVTAQAPEEMLEPTEIEATEEVSSESEDGIADLSEIEIEPNNEGVESLKKLLAALSDKNVAASMKGMKISINIELGDNK